MKDTNTISNDISDSTYKKERRKHRLLVLFIVLIISIGYAFLQAVLSISGLTNIQRNSWLIHFDPSTIYGASSPDLEYDARVVDGTFTSFEASVHFKKPGDYVMGVFDAKNAGTLDAMIDSFAITVDGSTTIPSYLESVFTYEDGIPLEKNQILKSGASETLFIKISFKKDITVDELPTTEQNADFVFSINYVQADDHAKEIREVVYSVGDDVFEIGEAIPNDADVYDTYEEALENSDYPIFLKHIIKDGVLYNTYAGFVVYNQNYFYPYGDPFFSLNRDRISDVFGKYDNGFFESYAEDGIDVFFGGIDFEEENDEQHHLMFQELYNPKLVMFDTTNIMYSVYGDNNTNYMCVVCSNHSTCNYDNNISRTFCGGSDD